MKCTEFNDNWRVRHLGGTAAPEKGNGTGADREEEAWLPVTLPYDAMLREPRGPQSRGEHNIGWFDGRDYEYEKIWQVDHLAAGHTYLLRFDGVYHNAQIFVNGHKCAERPYGYIDIYADITPFLVEGDNTIRVVAHNADQPNSRWYSGSGIYRPVYLFEGEGQYLIPDGIHVSTTAIHPAKISLSLIGSVDGEADYVIRNAQGETVLSGRAPVSAGTRWNKILQGSAAQEERAEGTAAATGDAGATAAQAGSTAAPAHASQTTGAVDTAGQAGSTAAPAHASQTTGAVDTAGQAGAQPSKLHAPKSIELTIPDASLWDADHPYLYTIEVSYGSDVVTQSFGIRLLTWDADKGLQINGGRLLLKGACIHSDNQLLGAETYPEAEERRVRLLKENGYNAIRSAHNPCCRYLLEACDKLGMYMMDEYADCWYIHKTKFDYAGYLPEWYRKDIANIAAKDYSHPCVVLYSSGNEVSETAQPRGIALTGKLTQAFHRYDPTRPVSCGVNIFFNLLSSMGFGVYSDDKAEKDAAKAAAEAQKQQASAANPASAKKKKAVGSEFYNRLAGLFGDKAMKMGATLHGCDVKTRDAFANMDIAGYNYGILRYRHDLREYPQRLILGSETFCKDAYQFMKLAKESPRIVGDFVWAGQDYIGETGIGTWEYEDYAPSDGDPTAWLTAGAGRIDITGKAIGEAYYTRAALAQEVGPYIAVEPVYQQGKHSPSAWKMSNAICSWSWHGCDGYKANVEVYADADQVDYVELYLDGIRIAHKKLNGDCIARFQVEYHDGTLKAAAFARSGQRLSEQVLQTAGEETQLRLIPEEDAEKAGIAKDAGKAGIAKDAGTVGTASAAGTIAVAKMQKAAADVGNTRLHYIHIAYTDANGIWKPMEKHTVKLTVDGGILKAAGNACPYNPDGYLKDTVRTYYGEALAIVETQEGRSCTITAEDQDAHRSTTITIA